MPTLPLSSIFDVTVSVSPQSPATPQFNQALIVGTSTIIPSIGPNSRVKVYEGPTILQQMITDGFATNSPEYKAAQSYMAQSPQPNYLQVGRQDLTAVAGVNINTEGTGYTVNDIVTIVQSGASLGQVKVTAVGAGGIVTGAQVIAGSQGTGYSVAAGLATTGGTGTGLVLDITAIGETPLQAVEACRLASYSWYLCYAIEASDADNIAIAEYAQTAVPQMQVFFSTTDAKVLTGDPTSIFATLKAGNYNRYQGVYSTTQSGLAPNNAYFAAGLMGVAMGLNTGLANSYFTLAFKEVIGMTVEPLTLSQYNAIVSAYGNCYVNFNNAYSWYMQGRTGSGQYFDQVLGLDMLGSDIQYAEADLLNSLGSVPQSDGGQAQLIHAANIACQASVTRGFLSPGTWTGATVLNLKAGDPVPEGYLCQSAPIAKQSSADRAARKAQPIYAAVILAGSMQSLAIAVYVQQ